MKFKWSIKKFSEIADFNPSEPLQKGKISKKIGMDKIFPFNRDITSYEVVPFTSGTKFRNGDTIMARITPCLENGKIAKVSILDEDEIGFGSTEFIVLRAKEEIDEDYLYYLTCSSIVREPAIKSMVGSSGRQRVQTDVVQNLEIEVPPYKEQRTIGKILKDIDDKIKLNNEINNNLEQQAKTIFENEFLFLEFLPKDWKQGNLLNIANYLNGLAMQKYRPAIDEEGIPVLKIKELRQGYCDDNSELCSTNIKPEYIIHDSDVIFSWSGSLLVDFWCGGTCGLNQHLFKVTSDKYDKWFYYAWTKHHLEHFITVATDKATTMGHIKRDELEKAKVIIPNSTDYKRIGVLLQPIYEFIIKNRIENKKLIFLRNTILPKLMSGEIDVSEINI